MINFVLFFFNMIPLFPLDGEKIAVNFLPQDWGQGLEKLRRFSFGPLLIAIWLLPRLGIDIVGWLVFSPAIWLVQLFTGG